MPRRPTQPTPPTTANVTLPEGATIVGWQQAGSHRTGLAPPPNVILGMAGHPAQVLGIVPPGGLTLSLVAAAAVESEAAQGPATPTGDGKQIHAWQDDPLPGFLSARPVPSLAGFPPIEIYASAPRTGFYPSNTPEFRYWNTMDALARSLSLWQSIIAKAAPDLAWNWADTPSLAVSLDSPEPDFNAYYDRKSLQFFHGDTPFGRVHTGASPDIVCHELGHAVLDAIKPSLWGAASHEAGAFHEAFGDISALLSALQAPEMQVAILQETGGRLYTNSRLSRMAEQMGAAIRLYHPQDVDPDCLRNAVNSFVYRDPTWLQPSGPAWDLSSEPHSFSRVFTGAFLEILASLVTATATNPKEPTPAELMQAAEDLAVILVRAVLNAPVVSNLFAQIAAGMLLEASTVSALYASILHGVFVRRGVLSPRSAAGLSGPDGDWMRDRLYRLAPPPNVILGMTGVGAGAYGIDRTLLLQAPSQQRPFSATSAAPDARPIEPASGLSAAVSFADDILRRGRVDYGDAAGEQPMLHIGRRFTTHRLAVEGREAQLHRCCFDCGLRRD